MWLAMEPTIRMCAFDRDQGRKQGTFSILELIALQVVWAAAGIGVVIFSRSSGVVPAVWYCESAIALGLTCIVGTVWRPKLLYWSKWTASLSELLTLACLGYLFQTVKLGLWGISVPPRGVLWLVCGVLVGPVFEELFTRGMILRSLLPRMNPWVAIGVTATLSALSHVSFWMSLPSQILLGIVYKLRENSIAASIACHVGMNAAVHFPTGLLG
jgi:membrane protease YdiL (CAAX protease family)